MGRLERLWRRGAEFLGVRRPILCGGMTWVSDPELVSAVSAEGAFGVLAGGNADPAAFERQIDECLAAARGPFAVNLITIAPHYRAHLEIVRAKNVPFVVFAGSFPKADEVRRVKASGARALAFASERSIAERLVRSGVDGLILEGSEAGGHIGHVSLTILLQQVLFDFRDFPVFVAGGLGDGRLMAHLLLMGARGCQFGTRFVLSEECRVHPAFKQAFLKARAREAVATPQYDSRLHVVAVRALKNAGMEEFGRLQLDLIGRLERGEITREAAQFEVERFWVGALRRAAVDGDVERGSLMAGQSVGLFHDIKPIRRILEDLEDEAEGELERVAGIMADLG